MLKFPGWSADHNGDGVSDKKDDRIGYLLGKRRQIMDLIYILEHHNGKQRVIDAAWKNIGNIEEEMASLGNKGPSWVPVFHPPPY